MTSDLKLNPIPVNRQAKSVAFDRGDNWNPAIKRGAPECYDAPPRQRAKPDGLVPDKDLTGVRRGMLTVAYLYRNDHGEIRWACKCDCGSYVIRKHRSLCLLNGQRWKLEKACCPRCEAKFSVFQNGGEKVFGGNRDRCKERRIQRLKKLFPELSTVPDDEVDAQMDRLYRRR